MRFSYEFSFPTRFRWNIDGPRLQRSVGGKVARKLKKQWAAGLNFSGGALGQRLLSTGQLMRSNRWNPASQAVEPRGRRTDSPMTNYGLLASLQFQNRAINPYEVEEAGQELITKFLQASLKRHTGTLIGELMRTVKGKSQ